MIYFIQFLNGILISFGIIIGFVLFGSIIMKNVNKEDAYNSNDLLEPFNYYLIKITQEENYEQINLVKNIILNLKKNIVIDDVNLFKIDKDVSILMSELDGKSEIKLHKKYIILGNKN